jgi:hypothetical protein
MMIVAGMRPMRTPVRFLVAAILVMSTAVVACAPRFPDVDCGRIAACGELFEAARPLVPPGTTRIVARPARGPVVDHIEFHACAPDGGYALIDVIRAGDGTVRASLGGRVPADPPCR